MSVFKYSAGVISGLILGVAAGAAAGLLLAPQPGSKSRKVLKKKIDEVKVEAEKAFKEMGVELEPVISEVKGEIKDQVKEKSQAVTDLKDDVKEKMSREFKTIQSEVKSKLNQEEK